MPQESKDHRPVIAALEEQSQFLTPSVIEREIAITQNPVSNGAQSFVQGSSPGRIEAATVDAPSTDGRIDYTSKGLSSKNTTNYRRSSNSSRSSTEEISIEECDVLTQFSSMMVRLHETYVNKDALKTQLTKFVVINHFNYKVRTSHKECLHVVCLDDNCSWIVHATKIKQTNFF